MKIHRSLMSLTLGAALVLVSPLASSAGTGSEEGPPADADEQGSAPDSEIPADIEESNGSGFAAQIIPAEGNDEEGSASEGEPDPDLEEEESSNN